VRVRLNDAAHAFPAGHRLRVSVSTVYWPIAWPSPQPVTLQVWPGDSMLTLPVRPPREEDAALRPFDVPEQGPTPDHDVLHPVQYRRSIERDLATNETIYTIFSDGGDYDGAAIALLPSIALELGHTILKEFRVRQWDPLTARGAIEQKTLLRRGAWEVRIECRTEMSCTVDAFRVRAHIVACETGREPFRREWDEVVPRDLV
jgi:hypothetical protein